MHKLNLQTPDRTVTIDLTADEMTVVVEKPAEEKVATAEKPALEWSDTLLEGEEVTYEKAEEAAKALGPGWRLPTRFELESLLDLSRHDPAIDTDKYPDTQSSCYWSSIPCSWREDAVWVVGFYGGLVSYGLRGYYGCVRAVRSGQ